MSLHFGRAPAEHGQTREQLVLSRVVLGHDQLMLDASVHHSGLRHSLLLFWPHDSFQECKCMPGRLWRSAYLAVFVAFHNLFQQWRHTLAPPALPLWTSFSTVLIHMFLHQTIIKPRTRRQLSVHCFQRLSPSVSARSTGRSSLFTTDLCITHHVSFPLLCLLDR